MALRVKQLLAAANHQLNQNQHGQTHGIQESDGMLQQIYTQLESITLLHKNHTDYNNKSDKSSSKSIKRPSSCLVKMIKRRRW